MINAYLIGETVYLRPPHRADAGVITSWFNNQDVLRTILRYQPMTVHAEEEWIDSITRSDKDLVLVIATKSDDQLVGITGLHAIDWQSRHASFGILIGETAHWGRGYGRQATQLLVDHAFLTLNLNRVALQVLAHHERGRQLYHRVGFVEEGVLRQQLFREGQYHDLVAMALLRDDWERR
jgi:RimJ/RimL family protein N-acetyltransferase